MVCAMRNAVIQYVSKNNQFITYICNKGNKFNEINKASMIQLGMNKMLNSNEENKKRGGKKNNGG